MATHPTLFARRAQLCVDLRGFSKVPADVLAAWLRAYAEGIGDGVLHFAAPDGMIRHENGKESPSEVRLDRTWTAKAELYTPAALRTLIETENANALPILVAQLRSPVGVVPFVGAGLSVPF